MLVTALCPAEAKIDDLVFGCHLDAEHETRGVPDHWDALLHVWWTSTALGAVYCWGANL